MFVRKKKNRSGSFSVQLISKSSGNYKVLETIGSSMDENELSMLVLKGEQRMRELVGQFSMFAHERDNIIESFVSELGNGQIRTVGPELVFGKIFDHIGYGTIEDPLFRHLVVSRLAFPLSKLKTVEYLYRYQGISVSIDSIYRFLDKLNDQLKETIEKIGFEHTKRVLKGEINIVFYDMTTLYFEAGDEDDLRKTGFSKDGKHSNPQIFLGLLVGLGGYAIGYDIFEGNIYEGNTLIPVIEKISGRFGLDRPVIVADAGLLNKSNIAELEEQGYQYILGARLKNSNRTIKETIMGCLLKDGEHLVIQGEAIRTIISYSDKRAKKDGANRKRGFKRLEKQINGGRLTKSNINNRGYNKYLKMEGNVKISIDREKYDLDQKWDGLKGYVTNSALPAKEIISNYKNLWHIEKAFRMSKTDLRIRPVYHRLRHRIEAHICLSFAAYTIYKELERVMGKESFPLSPEKAAEITRNIYQLEIVLPESRSIKNILLKMDEKQTRLIEIVNKNF